MEIEELVEDEVKILICGQFCQFFVCIQLVWILFYSYLRGFLYESKRIIVRKVKILENSLVWEEFYSRDQ